MYITKQAIEINAWIEYRCILYAVYFVFCFLMFINNFNSISYCIQIVKHKKVCTSDLILFFSTDVSLLILRYSPVTFGARKNLTKNNMYCIIVSNKKIKWGLMGCTCWQ